MESVELLAVEVEECGIIGKDVVEMLAVDEDVEKGPSRADCRVDEVVEELTESLGLPGTFSLFSTGFSWSS